MMESFRRSRGVALALAFAGAAIVLTAARSSADDEAVNEDLSAHHRQGREAHDHDRAERARALGEIRPLEEIMPLVRDRITGEIANIELERNHGVWIYEFKVIDRAGRLIEVRIDAKTGELVKIEGE
jgi:uncharacterized membrane protein YkoI